jgi:hypothetical protein
MRTVRYVDEGTLNFLIKLTVATDAVSYIYDYTRAPLRLVTNE